MSASLITFMRRFGRTRLPAREPDRTIAASGLFDDSYYLINGADVMAVGAEPIQHFHDYGWRENRRPNHFFDPRWYCSRYLVDQPDTDPLAHYIGEGERAGHRPIPFFDPLWYRAAYGIKPNVSPLAHYLRHRRSQKVSPHPGFDLAYYLGRHAAEIGPNRDPFMHHLRNGAALRDLDPSATVDAARYRREVMAGDTRVWTGLTAHEMRVPLVHRLHGADPPRDTEA